MSDPTAITPANIAVVLHKIIDAEPRLIALMAEFGPLAAALPAPFNVLADPLVQEALSVLPKLLPYLTQIAAALDSLKTAP